MSGALVRRALGVVAVLALLVTGIAWALASPTGGTADETYHLASIWCPRPIDSSGCQTRFVDGEKEILVPAKIAPRDPCFARNSGKTAECTLSLSDSELVYSNRYDDGNYPYGYYQLHHHLIGQDVDRSVMVIRVVNLLISLSLLGGVSVLLPSRLRQGFALALLIAWVPMGVYYVASVNPSGWALTGVMTYAAAFLGATQVTGRRRWLLLVFAALGALLCFLSRADASFFVLVVTLGVLGCVPWGKRDLWPLGIGGVLSVVGVIVMLGTGQAHQSGNILKITPAHSVAYAVGKCILSIPTFVGELYGHTWGAGSGDVPFGDAITVTVLAMVGMAIAFGAQEVSLRKIVSVAILVGALIGIPFVVALQNHWEGLQYYHGRYQLPLLAVVYMVWFFSDGREFRVSRPQVVLVVIFAGLIHSLTLRTILYRYVHGYDDPVAALIENLNLNVTWWRNIPISPMGVWIVGSIAFPIAVIAGLWLVRRGVSASEGSGLPARLEDPAVTA
nr:DUF2142 domain-containing protein [Actinomyces trachealis]